MAQRMLVCFDFEGAYGMPFEAPYDLPGATTAILDRLAAHQARAVFFVVGRMVEEHPEVITELAAGGHEIGIHGYEHDDLGRYDGARVAWLEQRLGAVCERLEALIGRRPTAFRAPYLLGPHFYRGDVYAVLRRLGFTWVSNREVRYPAELLRPDRLTRLRLPRPSAALARGVGGNRALLTLLNAGLVGRDDFAGSAFGRLRWLAGEREPFVRDGLVEVPLYSALDCDLLGLPRPDQVTPADLLDYATGYLGALAGGRGDWSMVTFHDWIVAGGNRIGLLDAALSAANRHGVVLSTPQHQPQWLIPAGPAAPPVNRGLAS